MSHSVNNVQSGESSHTPRSAETSKRSSLLRKALGSAFCSAALLSTHSVAVAQDRDARERGAEEELRTRVIEEIVVTATRRDTLLHVTPVAVSVIGEDTILKRRLVGMEDYLAGMPGVSYQDRGAAANTITIRGIGMGQQLDPNSPVGSYFGEVPITGLGTNVNGNQAGNADVKLVDIQRVEVLRGPQGTLYGSGTMGGTVRIIPNAPNLQEAEGRGTVEYSNTARRGGHNYMVQGVVNVPLIPDELAVRVAAYRFDNDGHIDNVAASHPSPNVAAAVEAGAIAEDRKRVGGDRYTGVRFTALWQPSGSNFSLTLKQLYQEIMQDGFKEVETDLPGRYLQSRPKVGLWGTGTEFVTSDLNITNLVLEYELPWGTILNSASRTTSEAQSDLGITFFGPPFIGIAALNTIKREVLINETRFTSNFDGPFQILGGVYYEDRTADRNPITLRWIGMPPVPEDSFVQRIITKAIQRQFAGFGEIAFTPFERLELTLGARYYEFTQSLPISTSLGVPTATQGMSASVDGTNYKVNVSYELTEQFFAYTQWSQGFREPRFQGPVGEQFLREDGLVDFQDGIARRVPEGLLDPDSVDNYEIGIKYQSNDGRISGSLTGFRIDWTGIPIVPSLALPGGAAFWFNAGEARTEGVEFETSAHLTNNWIVQLSASWISSELTEDAPGLGPEGTDLPGVADYNVGAALERRFTIGRHSAYARGDYTYVGEYMSQFGTPGSEAGDYHLVDFSAGVSIGNFDVGVFARNLTNADDFTWLDNVFDRGRAYRLRPRTIGLSFSASF